MRRRTPPPGGAFELLPEAIRLLRIERRMTQADLARASGISKPVIGTYERGTVRPHLSQLEKILAVVGADARGLAVALARAGRQPERVRRRRHTRPRRRRGGPVPPPTRERGAAATAAFDVFLCVIASQAERLG